MIFINKKDLLIFYFQELFLVSLTKIHNHLLLPMKASVISFWLILVTMFSSNLLFAQEKKTFLQQRFEGFSEIIDKGYTENHLRTLEREFSKIGISFTFDSLIYNAEHELISIKLILKNKKSKATLSILKNNQPIPNIQVGEIDGMIYIKTAQQRIPLKKEY